MLQQTRGKHVAMLQQIRGKQRDYVAENSRQTRGYVVANSWQITQLCCSKLVANVFAAHLLQKLL
jgi:hypothetical protein